MRSKQSFLNMSIAMIYFVINNIFAFVSKSVFIAYLGIEYSGLNSFLLNIIGVLNIVELGISTSVGYALYKPLKEKNYDEISEIMNLFKSLYKIIGLIVLLVGLIVSLFLDKLVKTDISISGIRFYFILYLISVLSSYFFTYTNVLPSADQKNYIVVRTQGNIRIVKNIVELIVIIVFQRYSVWLMIEIAGNALSYIGCNIKIKHVYPEIDFRGRQYDLKNLLKKHLDIVANIKNLFYHQIGSLAVNQTDNILISKFCNLIMVGKYTNYIYITNLLAGCANQVFNSIAGSIGNLVAENGNDSKSYNVWKSMYALTYFGATIVAYLFYKLSYNFISLWVGESNTLSNLTVLFIAVNIFFRIIRVPTEKFKNAYGIFYDKYAPIVEAFINLAFSVVMVFYYDVLGVVLGTVISNVIIIYLWKPYITFKDGFHKRFFEYLKISFSLTVFSVISVFVLEYMLNLLPVLTIGWINWILMTLEHGIITFGVSLSIFLFNPIFRNSLREIVLRIKVKK